jgi:uncharacterized membrane protein YphA (DoxX/SURF4 family)
MNTIRIDHKIIHFLRKVFLPTARISLAIIFIWFGLLKVLGLSPASGLVHALFDNTIGFMSFSVFYVLFAWFEVLIGVLFLIPRATRVVIPLLAIHMITTFMPLVFLPGETWNGFLVLTLPGQYIVKNLVIIAVALGIAAELDPLKRHS